MGGRDRFEDYPPGSGGIEREPRKMPRNSPDWVVAESKRIFLREVGDVVMTGEWDIPVNAAAIVGLKMYIAGREQTFREVRKSLGLKRPHKMRR